MFARPIVMISTSVKTNSLRNLAPLVITTRGRRYPLWLTRFGGIKDKRDIHHIGAEGKKNAKGKKA